ncbi:MAG TPA: RsmD family RNA methyltransferase, partial [Rubricoccaceae bacterium]
LKAPPGRDTRPTSDRVREALFNLLAARTRFDGAAVLDLFAGSGALAMEALSRGAASATVVERHGPTLAVAKANAAALGLSAAVQPVRADALAFLKRASGPPYGLAFADPPYALAEIPALPALVRPHLAPGALFALEHDTRHDFAGAPGLVLTRAYGQTVVSLFGDEAT